MGDELARGTTPAAEPERPEDEESRTDAEIIEDAEADAEAAAKARELPAEAKAQQMTPEEYEGIGVTPAAEEAPAPKAQPKAESKAEAKDTGSAKG